MSIKNSKIIYLIEKPFIQKKVYYVKNKKK